MATQMRRRGSNYMPMPSPLNEVGRCMLMTNSLHISGSISSPNGDGGELLHDAVVDTATSSESSCKNLPARPISPENFTPFDPWQQLGFLHKIPAAPPATCDANTVWPPGSHPGSAFAPWSRPSHWERSDNLFRYSLMVGSHARHDMQI